MTDFEQKIEFYRQRRARNIAVAVFLFIASIPVLIICEELFDYSEIGVVLMFLMIAAGVGLIVYTALSVPKDVAHEVNEGKFSRYNAQNDYSQNANDSNYNNRRDNPKNDVYSSISKLYWLIVTIIYLGISFTTMAWHITWLIWLIAGAVEQFFKILFSLNTPYKPYPNNTCNEEQTKDITQNRGNNG